MWALGNGHCASRTPPEDEESEGGSIDPPSPYHVLSLMSLGQKLRFWKAVLYQAMGAPLSSTNWGGGPVKYNIAIYIVGLGRRGMRVVRLARSLVTD